ncbi:MAG: HNH endonuclease family protein, partial [Acidovorax sp.]|nr:HNH endonuclease family protein [Acidovorax sp.]
AGVLKTFRVRQPFPLLLAAKRILDAPDFTGLLRATVVISMRFNVIGSYSTAEQERKYNEVAERVARNELKNLGQVLQPLRSIYPDDAAFRTAFAEKTIRTTDSRNNRVVRFILCALEKHLSGQAHDFASDAFNIEHVLPQNAPDGWGGIGNDDAEALVYRLGNMTLLEARANRDLGNLDYAQKRPTYQESGFAITRKLGDDHAEWTPERIAAQQNWMAAQATAIWRIAQLS